MEKWKNVKCYLVLKENNKSSSESEGQILKNDMELMKRYAVYDSGCKTHSKHEKQTKKNNSNLVN